MVWEYQEIYVVSHASLFMIGKNPSAPVLFAQSEMLSALSVLNGWSS